MIGDCKARRGTRVRRPGYFEPASLLDGTTQTFRSPSTSAASLTRTV
jgi:hypothetical protein